MLDHSDEHGRAASPQSWLQLKAWLRAEVYSLHLFTWRHPVYIRVDPSLVLGTLCPGAGNSIIAYCTGSVLVECCFFLVLLFDGL